MGREAGMAKHLVLCFDGTWNSADSGDAETNVARIARAVQANSGKQGVQQLTLYLRGVGSTGSAIDRVIDGAVGHGVDENIRSGYMFLAQNYEPGDKIFVFGFSRGAFTARSLVGFIGGCGLLKRRKLADLPKAWAYYRTEKERTPLGFCEKCESDCHHEPEIAFLGVWDTVGALGIPTTFLNSLTAGKYEFHNTSPSGIVKKARHALAIDEHRDEFVPTLWTGEAEHDSDIKQMWFAGAHSDVGGGYTDRTLADIPLVWMAEEAEKAGLDLDWTVLPSKETNSLAPQHESRMRYSRKDRLTPTIRRVMNKKVKVDFNERLYIPEDEHGKQLLGINEDIHVSVKERLQQKVKVLNGDDDKTGEIRDYKPKNL